MDNIERQTDAAHLGDTASDAGNDTSPANSAAEDSLIGEIAALIGDSRTYAQAELGFQKTRARLAGRHLGTVLVCAILALILVHIALLALAVGLVIALAPVVSIWGAIAVVVGGLLVLVIALGVIATKRVHRLSALFASENAETDA